MRYIGMYGEIDDFETKSLHKIQEHLERQMGDKFTDYETALIVAYNIIGRQTGYYYFSMKGKQWYLSTYHITDYYSWIHAKQPFKYIAQKVLALLGFKALEDAEWKKAFNIKK